MTLRKPADGQQKPAESPPDYNAWIALSRHLDSALQRVNQPLHVACKVGALLVEGRLRPIRRSGPSESRCGACCPLPPAPLSVICSFCCPSADSIQSRCAPRQSEAPSSIAAPHPLKSLGAMVRNPALSPALGAAHTAKDAKPPCAHEAPGPTSAAGAAAAPAKSRCSAPGHKKTLRAASEAQLAALASECRSPSLAGVWLRSACMNNWRCPVLLCMLHPPPAKPMPALLQRRGVAATARSRAARAGRPGPACLC